MVLAFQPPVPPHVYWPPSKSYNLRHIILTHDWIFWPTTPIHLEKIIWYHLEPFSEHHIIWFESYRWYQNPSSAEAGEVTFKRYPQLISQDNLPFVRSSSGQRVVDSATNWTSGTLFLIFCGIHPKHWAGFSFASGHVYNPTLSVILSEDVGL
jgi:hypothetical protein